MSAPPRTSGSSPSSSPASSRNSFSQRKPVPDLNLNAADDVPADADANGHAAETNGFLAKEESSASSDEQHLQLTDTQLHYLLKALIALELTKEWSALSQLGALTKYGPPFSSTASSSRNTKGGAAPTFAPSRLPDALFHRGMLRSHVLTFPGFSAAPQKYYTDRAQPWFDGIASHGLSTTAERGEPTKRMQLNMLLTRLISAWFTRGIRVVKPGSELGETLKQDTAARPGKREMSAINDVFAGSATGPEGWYVGVTAGSAPDTFLVGSQKKGEKMMFSRHTVPSFKGLDQTIRASGDTHTLPILTLTPYRTTPLAAHLQIYLRNLVLSLPRQHSSIRSKIDEFFSDTTGGVTVSAEEAAAASAAFKEQDAKAAPLHRAWLASGKKVDELNEAWRSWTDEITEDEKGLDKTFEKLVTPEYVNLPKRERLCVEKAGVWVAYFLYELFAAGPNAKESLAGVRWLLSLIPWWPLRQLLRIADPSKLIAALVAFILARPFGLQSLFQRLASAMLGSHASHCRKEAKLVETTIIQHVHASGEGEKLCEKVRKYVFESSVDERLEMNERAAREGVPLINAIISSSTPGSTPTTIPPAAAPQFQKLIALYSTARDYDSLIEFSSSATFVKIIKDTLTVVLYGPLTQWSKKCNLSDRVQDLHVFLTDLVEIARKKDVDLAAFLALCARHQQKLYYMFSEAYTRGGTLTDPLRHWCALGLGYMRTSSLDIASSLASPSTSSSIPKLQVDLPSLLSSSSPSTSCTPAQRAAVLKETDALIHWTKWMKIRWHIEMRRNVLLQQGARLLAEMVDVDQAMRFVGAQLGEDFAAADVNLSVSEPVVNGNGVANGSGASAGHKHQHHAPGRHATSVSSTKFALSDQFAWGWFTDPSVLSVLDQDPTTHHRAGPKRPAMTETRKLLGPFIAQIKPLLGAADESTLKRVKASPNGG